MDAPPVRYVTTSDGYDIAYAVNGEGRPLVFMPQPISHIQVYWTQETWVLPWLQGLATRFQLIQYDGRGQGMSTRGLRETFSMEEATSDLEAVVDGVRLDNFVLMAVQGFGHSAVRYAVQHPERVEALVLVSCAISFADWPLGMLLPLADQDWDALLRSQAGLSQARDISASVQRQKQSISQADYRLLSQAMTSSDLAGVLPLLRTPALILHPRDSLNSRPEESMKLAAAIPGARMALIDGATPLGDHMHGLRVIEEFLSGLAAQVAPTPPMASRDDSEAGLSAREVQVLRRLAAGRSNQQIADELVISLNTVARHVSNIFDKTGAANRAEAASYAHRHSLVT
jgi:DNA-binding CsgD family transcriptional regulator/pimeloyl-ACP methyl ester carboxylesterase